MPPMSMVAVPSVSTWTLYSKATTLCNTFRNIYNYIQFIQIGIVFKINRYTTGNTADEYSSSVVKVLKYHLFGNFKGLVTSAERCEQAMDRRRDSNKSDGRRDQADRRRRLIKVSDCNFHGFLLLPRVA